MKAAFIGNRHDIEIYASVFKEAFSKVENHPIQIQGVLSNTPENTTNLAILFNVKAYLNLNTLMKECDVLFVCYKDAMLKGFVSMLKNTKVRNKTICFFSPNLTAEDVAKGTSNSYYSVSFPYICKKEKSSDYSRIPVLFEKAGSGNANFETAIENCFPNATFCDRKTFSICYMAQRILSVHIKLCMRMSRFLYNKAGVYNPGWFELLAMSSIKEEMLYPDEHGIKALNFSHCKEFCKSLSQSEHPYIAEYILDKENLLLNENSSPEKEDIKKLLKKTKKSIKTRMP